MPYNVTIAQAIQCNDFGTLKSLVNKQYHYAALPTISELQIENFKLSCVYSNRKHLLPAFEKYSYNVFA